MSDITQGVTRREALKRGVVVGGAAVVWAAPTAQAFGMSSNLAASTSANAGCTPGFWKTSTNQWPAPYAPDHTLETYFTFDANCAESYMHRENTLIEALNFGGSYEGEAASTIGGATRILLRAAVAWLLNVESFYPGSTVENEVLNPVTFALASCDRQTIINQARVFDDFNNRGCPLSADASQ